MGLFALNPASRFIDGLSGDLIQSEAEIVLTAFFNVMKAREIHLGSASSRILVDLVEKETGRPFSPSPVDARKVLPPKAAAHVCAFRLTEFPQLPNISGGVSFGIEEAPDNPKNSWQLFLHRGPLPLLSLEIADGSTFHPPSGWEGVLANTGGAANVVWTHGKYFGAAESIYLFKKRRKLFPHSKGISTDNALKSGRYLRQLCSDVWRERPEATKPYRLSSWKRTQKRFMKSFDDLLVRKVGAEELSQVLAAMGTNLPEWLAASDVG